MNIRVRKLDYNAFINKKFKPEVKPKKPNAFFRFLLKMVSSGDVKSCNFKANYINFNKKDIKEPCLILMNHSSFLDLKIAVTEFSHIPMNIVSTSDTFIGKRWLMRQLGCVPTVKYVTDFRLVKEISNCVKKFKTSILMYPEACYSIDGTCGILPNSLVKFIKLLKIPVITIIAKGSYHRQPLYNELRKNDVNVTADIELIFNKEKISSLSEKEIFDVLTQKFSFDNWKWQQENNVLINSPERAVGLNKFLYKCPKCGNEGNLISNGIELTCPNCNKSYILSETGFIEAKDGETEFKHIPDWYNWQRNSVKEEIINENYHFEDDVYVYMTADSECVYEIGEGHLIHDLDGFHLSMYDGKIKFEMPSHTSYSANCDFYWYEIGDVIAVSDIKKQFYCIPKSKKDVVAKLKLATEEIYKLKK